MGPAPRAAWLDGVAADVAAAKARGTAVILVSSGAIALARRTLGLTQPRLRLEEKQAAAAVGQIRLAQAWAEALSAHGLTAAQLLLTLDDTEDRRRYLNARATLTTLLGLGCVPVINEKRQRRHRRNPLRRQRPPAARVAEMVQADRLLLLLSDIDGLYTADPRTNPAAQHIPTVPHLTPEIEAMGGEPPPGYSSGGMRTKLAAARIATQAAAPWPSHLARSRTRSRRSRPGAAAPGSCPPPRAAPPASAGSPAAWPRSARWWSMPAPPAPWPPAAPLLPAGLRAVEGMFDRGDPVIVRSPDGITLAQGLSAYGAEDLRRIAGHRSEEIEALLGWRGRDEAIHRDDLVLLLTQAETSLPSVS